MVFDATGRGGLTAGPGNCPGDKPAKLARTPLVRQVTTWLEELWSPQEIAQRLRLEFPDEPMMQVSH